MKIGEFARAARTTTRTVRHYHQLGELPEPGRRANGYREYTLGDLVRMLRISWLTRAGVPLKTVGDLLEDERSVGASGLARDLELVAQTIHAERERLDRQLRALGQISESLHERAELTALPRELADAVERVSIAANPELRAVLARDGEMLEIMALPGELPEQLTAAYVALADDPEQVHQSSRIARTFAALEGKPPANVSDRIDEVVEMFLAAPIVRELFTGIDIDDPPSHDETPSTCLIQLSGRS